MLHFKGLCNNYQEGRGGGAEKLEGGALHKIAAKIGGAQSFIRNVNKIKRNKRFSKQAS